MIKKIALTALASLIIANSGQAIAETPIPIDGLYNTGVSDAGQVLSGGSVDPHYSLSGGHAFVTLNNVWPFWPGTSTSAYISPDANLNSLSGGGGVSYPPGTHTYTTQFDFSVFNGVVQSGLFASASLTGTASADDYVTDVKLNGVRIAQNPGSQTTVFSAPKGIVAGTNTLSFVVTNGPGGSFGNPSGLIVNLSGSYTPFTSDQYVRNTLAGISDDVDPVDASRLASQRIIELRKTSPATSSQNTYLRDAEYALEGYTGGVLWAGGALTDILGPDNLIGTLGPVGGLELYNLGKYLGYAWASTNGLPATPPGGIEANLLGYDLGMRGVPLSELPDALNNIAKLPPASTDPLQAMAPTIAHTYSSIDNAVGNAVTNISSALFGFAVSNPSTSVWIDPASARSLSWAVLGNEFMSLTIPQNLLTDFINANISFLNYNFAVPASGFLDFSSYAPGGISDFQITGIADNGDELIFGFNFAYVGDTLLSLVSGLADNSSSGGSGSGGASPVPDTGSTLTLFGMALVAIVGIGKLNALRSAVATN